MARSPPAVSGATAKAADLAVLPPALTSAGWPLAVTSTIAACRVSTQAPVKRKPQAPNQ